MIDAAEKVSSGSAAARASTSAHRPARAQQQQQQMRTFNNHRLELPSLTETIGRVHCCCACELVCTVRDLVMYGARVER